MSSNTLPNSAATRHLERLEDVSPTMAKAELKKLEGAWKEDLGRAIQRAFALAGLSQKEAAALLGRDVAQVSRWIAATEPPQFAAIFAVACLRYALVVALAELAGPDVIVETVVRVQRRVA